MCWTLEGKGTDWQRHPDSHLWKHEKDTIGDMAQRVRCWPCMPADLSLLLPSHMVLRVLPRVIPEERGQDKPLNTVGHGGSTPPKKKKKKKQAFMSNLLWELDTMVRRKTFLND